jgi:hypothetical protein
MEILMKIKNLALAIRALSLLLLVSGTWALAQDHRPVHFSGLINDYSPSTVKGGPWEMHGQWSLDFREEWRTGTIIADFSADMTMSDYGTTDGLPDPTKSGQSPHTHHIKLTSEDIISNMDGCPTVSPAARTGFQIKGPVSLITGNGTNAPFETDPPTSTLQICITGGDEIPYSITNSNISLVFSGPATMHFGTQAIHGVVRNAQEEEHRESRW